MTADPKSGMPIADGLAEPRAGRRGGYSSPVILERRRRILFTARKLIAERDIRDISMDEIADLAGVAKRTLYNIFKSRHLLIAAAIYKYFEDFELRISYSTPSATPERMIEHLDTVIRRNLEVRSYTRTLLSAYFSPDADDDVRKAIFEIAAHSHRPWVERLHLAEQLQPWIDPTVLVEDLVRYRYSLGLDWSLGRIEDDQFGPTIITGVLSMVAGACCKSAREQIDAALADWSGLEAC